MKIKNSLFTAPYSNYWKFLSVYFNLNFEQRFYCTRQFLIFKRQVLIFEQIFEQNFCLKFWFFINKYHSKPEKGLTLLGLPQFTPVFKNRKKNWKLFVLEVLIRARSPSSQSLMMQIKIFPDIDYFSPWGIKRFRTMRRNQSFQN